MQVLKICSHCLQPIEEGQKRIFRVHSYRYHKHCVKAMLQGYRKDFDQAKGKDLPKIMTDMERAFDIPMLKNEAYNDLNADVIDLYKEISNARDL